MQMINLGKIFYSPRPISNAQNSLLEDAKVETLESLGGLISKIKFPSWLGSFSKWKTGTRLQS